VYRGLWGARASFVGECAFEHGAWLLAWNCDHVLGQNIHDDDNDDDSAVQCELDLKCTESLRHFPQLVVVSVRV
jgi:hypothetical protein